jgi:hypothetical protein
MVEWVNEFVREFQAVGTAVWVLLFASLCCFATALLIGERGK